MTKLSQKLIELLPEEELYDYDDDSPEYEMGYNQALKEVKDILSKVGIDRKKVEKILCIRIIEQSPYGMLQICIHREKEKAKALCEADILKVREK